MKENTVYNTLIAISLIAITIVTFFIFTTKTTEPFTELYFEDHLNLPKTIEPGKYYAFEFTVHNLENKQMDYEYQMTIETDQPFPKPTNTGFITLENNETKTTKQNFKISKEFQTAKITVTLAEQDQEIHFWVKQK